MHLQQIDFKPMYELNFLSIFFLFFLFAEGSVMSLQNIPKLFKKIIITVNLLDQLCFLLNNFFKGFLLFQFKMYVKDIELCHIFIFFQCFW